MITLNLLLTVCAFVAVVASALGARIPLWIPVLLLTILHLLPYVPREVIR